MSLKRSSGTGGGGAGDASAAKQDAQTALLTTMNTSLDELNVEGPAAVEVTPSDHFSNTNVTETKVLVSAVGVALAEYFLHNTHATDAGFLQFFDVDDPADVTLGTTVPDWVIPLKGKESANLAGMNLKFENGIVIAATASATGSGAPPAGFIVNLGTRPV